MYDIQTVISDLKQIATECEKVTSDNITHKIANIEHGILNIADYLENYCPLGWHPASELPEKPTSKLGRVVILTLDGKLNFNYYVDGWDMSNVKWWCYPPKEE